MNLNGKVAIVTGGSRGLGKGYALALAEAGANVAIADIISAEEALSALKKISSEAKDERRKFLAIKFNVTNLSSINQMVEKVVDEFGKIDILVNNAGMNIRKPAIEVTGEDWDKVVNTNVKGAFFCAQAVGKVMIKQRRGKIINIGSLTSKVALPNMVAYAVSRGGILMLTKSLAIEWAKYNINVNAIGPGYFKTPQTAPLFADKQWVKETLKKIPLGRTGLPEDLGGTVVFLASEASDYITGQIIFVDGGWLAAA